MRESEFRVLFDSQLVGIAYIDPAGTFMRVNRTFAELLGYTTKDLEVKRRWQDVTHPEDLEATDDENKAVLSGEESSYRASKRYLHKHGYTVWVNITVSRVEDEGERVIHLIKQVNEIRMNDRNVTVAKDAAGRDVLQPIVPLTDFIFRNWKVIAPVLIAVFGGVGKFASDYYASETELRTLRKEADNQKDDIKQLRERVNDRTPNGKTK